MIRTGAVALLFLCTACGVETAGTAASGAAIKKQEMDAGRQTLQRAEEKIGKSVELQQQRAAQPDPDK